MSKSALSIYDLSSQVRALLVDDNVMNLKILQAYCKKRTYEYESACDGKEALATYIAACEAGLPPTICLLDLQMPVCDGITCAQKMRAYELEMGIPRCPIIMGEFTILLLSDALCIITFVQILFRPVLTFTFTLVVTAQSGDMDRRSSVEAGTDAYYVKPLRISTLDDIVARYARV